jgi:hypothetical protein
MAFDPVKLHPCGIESKFDVPASLLEQTGMSDDEI